jgi:hypothetical protein
MIQEIQRDVSDQIFRQEQISERLDAIFDTLSGTPSSTRCPICQRPYFHAQVWNHPSNDEVGGGPPSSQIWFLFMVFTQFF